MFSMCIELRPLLVFTLKNLSLQSIIYLSVACYGHQSAKISNAYVFYSIVLFFVNFGFSVLLENYSSSAFDKWPERAVRLQQAPSAFWGVADGIEFGGPVSVTTAQTSCSSSMMPIPIWDAYSYQRCHCLYQVHGQDRDIQSKGAVDPKGILN